MDRDEIIEKLADIIGEYPCLRCRMLGGAKDCDKYDCRALYRAEARAVVGWLEDRDVRLTAVLGGE